MTATLKGEQAEGRKAKNTRGQRSYTRVFKVESDSTADTAFDIGSATGLPVIGDAFPDDANAFCKSISVSCQAGYKHWLVTCEYDDTYEIDNASTPENDDVRISWSSELFQREAWKDKDGNGVLNSAGDPFNPPLMRDDHRIVCHILKNVSTVPQYVLTFPNVVNSTACTIDGLLVPKRYAKVGNIGVSEEKRRNGVVYREVSIEIQIRNQEWDFEPLDAGFRELDPSDSTARVRITNEDGTDITEPALLDGAGAQIDDPDPADAVFLSFRVYREDNFIGNIPGVT